MSQTATFYNPSVLKTIDWENKLIYITFGILNVVFSTQNRYFPFFNSTFKLQAGKGRGGRGGGESGGEGGRGCFCLLLRRIRFVYNFVRLTLISHDF